MINQVLEIIMFQKLRMVQNGVLEQEDAHHLIQRMIHLVLEVMMQFRNLEILKGKRNDFFFSYILCHSHANLKSNDDTHISSAYKGLIP